VRSWARRGGQRTVSAAVVGDRGEDFLTVARGLDFAKTGDGEQLHESGGLDAAEGVERNVVQNDERRYFLFAGGGAAPLAEMFAQARIHGIMRGCDGGRGGSRQPRGGTEKKRGG